MSMWRSQSDRNTTLAGNIIPVLDKLAVSSEQVEEISESVREVGELEDIFLIVVVGWALLPIVRYVMQSRIKETSSKTFRETTTYQVFLSIAQVARIALLVYIVDILDICLGIMGFEFSQRTQLSRPFAKVAYTLWMASRFHSYKHYLLRKYLGEKQKKHGLARLINHLSSGLIGAMTAFFLIDVLDVEMGFTFKSAFAFGSAGTLALTLASQGLISQFINGLALTVSANVYEGELVQFGDSTCGKVLRMGWLQTSLRGANDLVMTVPNSFLAAQKITNMSRDKLCQVYQELRFHYQDADKLPSCINDMKEEIKKNCPNVITDGTRQFRIVWTDFKDDHLQVMVDLHFRLPAIGDLYWNNRQVVLQTIHEVVKKHEMEFAVKKRPLS